MKRLLILFLLLMLLPTLASVAATVSVRVKQFTVSKKVYTMIICDERSKTLLLSSTLRKSYS